MAEIAIQKDITYFGHQCTVGCDARCDKAWGRNSRPKKLCDPDDHDDVMFFADQDLGIAPDDPGTYEGGQAKPSTPDARLNKWCVRECERSVLVDKGEPLVAKDWSKSLYDIPSRHTST